MSDYEGLTNQDVAPVDIWEEMREAEFRLDAEQEARQMEEEKQDQVAEVDDPEYDEDDELEDAEEWRPGECDNCYGGDENGVTATGPLGPLYCACFIGQGADEEDCRCGPED